MSGKTRLRGNWPGKRPDPVIVEREFVERPPHNKGHSKYHALFSALRPGRAVECDPAERKKLGNALNMWLRLQGRADAERAAYAYEPGAERAHVFLVKKGKTQC